MISCHLSVQSLRRAPITSESGNWVLAICSWVTICVAANLGGRSVTSLRVGLVSRVVASEQLAATSLNYIGYVEGRDIFNGKVDVVVCDGFTGNIALKSMEGVASFAGGVL